MDYRGNVGIILFNFSDNDFAGTLLHCKRGDVVPGSS